MTIDCATTKSSAVSVWLLPALAGRERVATFPSGSPVEKEKGAAEAPATSSSSANAPAVVLLVESAVQRRAGVSLIVFVFFIIMFLMVCLFSLLIFVSSVD